MTSDSAAQSHDASPSTTLGPAPKHTAAPEAGPRFREHFFREARAALREHFR